MGLQNLTFISMADEKFIGPLMVSVSQAMHFYPESEYFIYDVGLSEKSKKDFYLNNENQLVVSERAFNLLNNFNLKYCDIEKRSADT